MCPNSEQTIQRLQVLSNSTKVTNEELKKVATSSRRTNQRLKEIATSSRRTNQQMTDLLRSGERTNEELRAISASNKRIWKILDGFNAKLDAFSKKLDRLISASHDISNTITIASMKKDFDILFNARQMLRRQKLVKGILQPAFLFQYKNPNDFKEIRRTLIKIIKKISCVITHRKRVKNAQNKNRLVRFGNPHISLLGSKNSIGQGAATDFW